nr:MAG TPA: hypothetical protein [Caudoviricetes sp.]
MLFCKILKQKKDKDVKETGLCLSHVPPKGVI